jgi:hypothetical protein
MLRAKENPSMHRATLFPVATVFAALAVVSACSREQPPPPAAAEGARVLPFVENDYPAALARAKERKTPLFVEVWAPW